MRLDRRPMCLIRQVVRLEHRLELAEVADGKVTVRVVLGYPAKSHFDALAELAVALEAGRGGQARRLVVLAASLCLSFLLVLGYGPVAPDVATEVVENRVGWLVMLARMLPVGGRRPATPAADPPTRKATRVTGVRRGPRRGHAARRTGRGR